MDLRAETTLTNTVFVIYAFMVNDVVAYIGKTLSARFEYRMREHLHGGSGAKRLWASLNTLQDLGHQHVFKPLGYFTGTPEEVLAVETACMRYFGTIASEEYIQKCRAKHSGTTKRHPDIEIDHQVSHKLNEVQSSTREDLIENKGGAFIESLDSNFKLPTDEYDNLDRRINAEKRMMPYKHLEVVAEALCKDYYEYYSACAPHHIVNNTTLMQEISNILEKTSREEFPDVHEMIKLNRNQYHPDKNKRITNGFVANILNSILALMQIEKESKVTSEFENFSESKKALLDKFLALRNKAVDYQYAPRRRSKRNIHLNISNEEHEMSSFLENWKHKKKSTHFDEINIIMSSIPWWTDFISSKQYVQFEICKHLNTLIRTHGVKSLKKMLHTDRAFKSKHRRVYRKMLDMKRKIVRQDGTETFFLPREQISWITDQVSPDEKSVLFTT